MVTKDDEYDYLFKGKASFFKLGRNIKSFRVINEVFCGMYSVIL